MIQFRGAGAGLLALVALWGAAGGGPDAMAARVDGIYAETVPVTGSGADATRSAFGEALRRVLVKATGNPAAGRDPALLAALGDTTSLVQQYRRDAAGNLWAQFDPAALRRGIEAAGYPVWGEDRPLTVAWIAYDAGGGDRDVLGGSGGEGTPAAALRSEFLAAATARAVPVVLPLRDSADVAALGFSDVWGEFPDAIARASGRYGADAVLVGRARLGPQAMVDVRWTLVAGNERAEWRGGIADGPAGLAERLARRLAGRAGAAAGPLRIAVEGVRSFDQYGAVLGHLQALDVIESVAVAGARGEVVEFDVVVRGDAVVLERALAVRRLVEPAPDGPAGGALRYRLAAVP